MEEALKGADLEDRKYPCTKCGAHLRIQAEPEGQTLIHTAVCPSCKNDYPTVDLIEIQSKTDMGEVPVVTTLAGARMLGKPGKRDWVMQEFRGDVSLDRGAFFVKLSAIRSYADLNQITIEPTPAIFWLRPHY
jgi:hypothetical protein